jgi:Pyruvate/2-oxoacid:ferredoxin oxidoreductase delta subunit
MDKVQNPSNLFLPLLQKVLEALHIAGPLFVGAIINSLSSVKVYVIHNVPPTESVPTFIAPSKIALLYCTRPQVTNISTNLMLKSSGPLLQAFTFVSPWLNPTLCIINCLHCLLFCNRQLILTYGTLVLRITHGYSKGIHTTFRPQ